MPPVDEVTPADFSEILALVHDRPERELIQNVLLRSQSMAAYQPENRGHFGLALQAYAHFTSPIRRYPDLLVHRAIRYALTGRKPADYTYSPSDMAAMAIHCSQRERRAEEAERDVDERFKCAWMAKHVGEEFDGVVTGVTSFGLFVELDESNVSGLVHISQLANDYYHFDATRKLLKGERTGAQFRLGDHVRIQVLRASLEDRKIDFRLVAPRATAAPVASGKAYDYAASGERYSLPKAAAAKTPGMFGRAAKAIGRAFGRKEAVAPPVAATPPVAAEPARRTRRQADVGQRPAAAKKTGNASARRPRKSGGDAAPKRETAATKAKAPKKSSGRRSKPKSRSES
jgi:ribonuclease R